MLKECYLLSRISLPGMWREFFFFCGWIVHFQVRSSIFCHAMSCSLGQVMPTDQVLTETLDHLRVSPTLAQYVTRESKFSAKKLTCAGFALEIGFPAPNSCSLLWLVKGTTQFCTSKKECNKFDLTTTQHF